MTQFNETAYRQGLLASDNYIGRSDSADNLQWANENGADVLEFISSSTPANLVVVGQVVPGRSYLGPAGNTGVGTEYRVDLESAKQALTIRRTVLNLLGKDWSKGVETIGTVQEDIARTTDGFGKVDKNGRSSELKLARKLWIKRDVPLGKDDEIDAETDKWPIPDEHLHAFNRVKMISRINRVPVYDIDDNLLRPDQVTSSLENALVEVVFTMKHYYIKKDNRDIYVSDMKQVRILTYLSGEVGLDDFERGLQEGKPIKFGEKRKCIGASDNAVAGPSGSKGGEAPGEAGLEIGRKGASGTEKTRSRTASSEASGTADKIGASEVGGGNGKGKAAEPGAGKANDEVESGPERKKAKKV
ncbi:hypothetical protein BDN72DRAFT_878139 [Pluteus cervinus]|uniref:Uncharacterized protein n=1 Tax=Pluteus cervinus TaxID=181527 RepID=A0ACD3AXH8_9AGAR|nr:hypothetical protein BDN72DRAFT_878139 [Pluteus cervinus]